MTNEALIDERLSAIDQEVLAVLREHMPEHQEVATETYKFGLYLRRQLLQDISCSPRRAALESLLRNESFYRLVVLIMLLVFKGGTGPLLRVLSHSGR